MLKQKGLARFVGVITAVIQLLSLLPVPDYSNGQKDVSMKIRSYKNAGFVETGGNNYR
jgi:hypothetical protein